MNSNGKKSMLIPPYGGKLVNLVVDGEEREALIRKASSLPSIQLSARSMCDLELMATGAFSPVDRFMAKADYDRVLAEMQLADGTLFPLPITLPGPENQVQVGHEVALRSSQNDLLAIMMVEEAYHWDSNREALQVYGTLDVRHPLVAEMASWGKVYISGSMKVLNLPKHYDFVELRRAPAQVRATLEEMGFENVVAFQTRNPMHRVHEELTKRAAAEVGGVLLIHPSVGMTKPGDVDHYTRVRGYRILAEKHYDRNRTVFS